MPLPQGVTVTAQGRYRVRIKRGTHWFQGGYFDDRQAAVKRLAELSEDLPRAPSRVPAFDWSNERKRQMDLYSGGRKPRNVHPGPSGWTVALVRGKRHYYFGHFQDLRLALEARDKAEEKHPARGRH